MAALAYFQIHCTVLEFHKGNSSSQRLHGELLMLFKMPKGKKHKNMSEDFNMRENLLSVLHSHSSERPPGEVAVADVLVKNTGLNFSFCLFTFVHCYHGHYSIDFLRTVVFIIR